MRQVTRSTGFCLVFLLAGCQASKNEAITQLDGPTGRISGLVTLAYLNTPGPTIIKNDKDSQTCGSQFSKLDLLVSEDTHGLANVVTWIADIDLPSGYRPPHQELRMVAQRCQFGPHVSAMTVGSMIQVRNVDPIAHSANLSGGQDEKIELANQSGVFTTEARAPGFIKVRCADHDWMEAFVRVDPHPFHAVTNSDGEFTIDAVPVGKYKLGVWHERFGEQESEVSVRSGEVTRIELHCPGPRSGP
jgi:hypothetical protein